MAPRMPNYDDAYYRDRESWPDFRAEAEALVRLARLSPESRVLELGCGGGELLSRLGRGARLAVGVDLSTAALHLARRRASDGKRGVWVLRASAESLPFADGSFDAVVGQHLVEHLPDPARALREWHRVLRPGGVLALATPNAAYPDPALFHDPSHATIFTPAALRSALEDAGFRVVHLFALFPYLGRGRIARAASIRLAPLARLPGLANRGRTVVAAAARRTRC